MSLGAGVCSCKLQLGIKQPCPVCPGQSSPYHQPVLQFHSIPSKAQVLALGSMATSLSVTWLLLVCLGVLLVSLRALARTGHDNKPCKKTIPGCHSHVGNKFCSDGWYKDHLNSLPRCFERPGDGCNKPIECRYLCDLNSNKCTGNDSLHISLPKRYWDKELNSLTKSLGVKKDDSSFLKDFTEHTDYLDDVEPGATGLEQPDYLSAVAMEPSIRLQDYRQDAVPAPPLRPPLHFLLSHMTPPLNDIFPSWELTSEDDDD